MRTLCFFLVTSTLALLGCSEDTGDPIFDAGPPRDSGGGARDAGAFDGGGAAPDSGGVATDAGASDVDSGSADVDAAVGTDAGADFDGGPACEGRTMGSCSGGLTCIGCPEGPIMEHYLCTTSCMSDAECTDAARPHCNLPGVIGGGGPGLCTSLAYICTWGAMCAAPNTPIATPDGEREIASLREGDFVYSVHHDALVPVPLVRVASTVVTAHHVIRVELENGRVIEMSAGHPTADGRFFGNLSAGDILDGARIEMAARVPYGFDRTHDILPASDTGTYVAAGVLVGTTLAR